MVAFQGIDINPRQWFAAIAQLVDTDMAVRPSAQYSFLEALLRMLLAPKVKEHARRHQVYFLLGPFRLKSNNAR